MAAETPETPGHIAAGGVLAADWSERELLLHLVQHAEYQSDALHRLETQLDRFRPLLDMLMPNGQPPDMVSMAQTARAVRKGRRHV